MAMTDEASEARREEDDVEVDQAIAELERRKRRRRPVAATLTLAPAIVVGAIVVGFLVMARDARQNLKVLNKELADKQQAISEARAVEQALRAEIQKEKQELLELEKDKREMADYVERLRAAISPSRGGAESVPLGEEGSVPAAFRSALKPRARATPRTIAGIDMIDVDLWIEAPAGRANAIASVRYDLNARYYKDNHFLSDSQRLPQKAVRFTVLACESKVLVTVKLKPPGGTFTIDFDWCKATKWPPRTHPAPEATVKGTPIPLQKSPERPIALPRRL